jgi:hypothetical protein
MSRFAIVCTRPIGHGGDDHRAIKQAMRDHLAREKPTRAKAGRISYREGNWLYQQLRIDFDKD